MDDLEELIPDLYSYNEEIDLNSCRFCMRKSESNQTFISDLIKKNFQILVGFELKVHESLPTITCSSCSEDIVNSARVKSNILYVQNKLLSLLEAKTKNHSTHIKQELEEVVFKCEVVEDENQDSENIFLGTTAFDQSSNLNDSCDEEEYKTRKTTRVKIKDLADGDSEEPRLECTVCKQTYLRKKYLRRHQLRAHPRVFTRLRKKVPTKSAVREEMYECDDCGRKLPSLSSLKKHQIASHKRKFDKEETDMREKVACPDCGVQVARWSLKTHVQRIHIKIKRFECDKCGKMYYQKCELETHMKSRHAPREITKVSCHLCGKPFLRKESLKNHINVVHLNIVSNVCDVCGQGFQSLSSYETHIRSKHTFEKPFQCEECEKRFHSTSAVRAHKIRNHTKKKEICEICSQVFANLLSLQAHKKRMHEERNYPCTFEGCGKKFVKPFLLRSHMNVHFQMKKFQCTRCDLSYYNSTHLKRHVQSIHMKIKINCELPGCNSRFAQKNTYRNHILSHHKDLGEEGTQYMLKKIREMQIPAPEFDSYDNEEIN